MPTVHNFIIDFMAVIGFGITIGFFLDGLSSNSYKQKLVALIAKASSSWHQDNIRDVLKQYLDTTAFRFFRRHPFSIDSLLRSIALSASAIVLLTVIYLQKNSIPLSAFLANNSVFTVLLIIGIIVVDFFSIVQTLYIMRYAQATSHVLEIIFLFVVDVILTLNLFSLLFAFWIALSLWAWLSISHDYVVYSYTRPEKIETFKAPVGCFYITNDASKLDLPDDDDQLKEEITRLEKQKYGATEASCSYIFFKNAEQPYFYIFPVTTYYHNETTDLIRTIFHGCRLVAQRVPVHAAINGITLETDITIRSKRDVSNPAEAAVLVGHDNGVEKEIFLAKVNGAGDISGRQDNAIPANQYMCQIAPADVAGVEFRNLIFLYSTGYEIASQGQKYWSDVLTMSPSEDLIVDFRSLVDLKTGLLAKRQKSWIESRRLNVNDLTASLLYDSVFTAEHGKVRALSLADLQQHSKDFVVVPDGGFTTFLERVWGFTELRIFDDIGGHLLELLLHGNVKFPIAVGVLSSFTVTVVFYIGMFAFLICAALNTLLYRFITKDEMSGWRNYPFAILSSISAVVFFVMLEASDILVYLWQ